ncbi:MAG: isoprenylcysteine carboxylmethyltransferase family protein [Candidatus Thorarchaeota archaeon]|nr:isoprenylcysteine carboxylmethyltransferase family protein [Candidatus Thorarchaeota archaeon]
MELFPIFGVGWLNGWLLLWVWWLIQGLSVLVIPEDVRDRLFEFDRKNWKTGHRVSFAFGKAIGLVFLIITAFTSIDFSSIGFLIGLSIFVIGLLGLVWVIRDFKNTPLEEPVTIGIYKFSRHPQLVMLLVIGIGMSLALSSWILLILRIVSFGFQHAGVIAEENECLDRFGESYKEYMENVPRYFLI